MQSRLFDAYMDNGKSVLEFGHTCLVIRDGLVHKQLAVFNVSVDSDLWDGHGMNQTADRVDLFLGFLQKYIPFAASAPRTPEQVQMQAAPAAPLRVLPGKPEAEQRQQKF